uniref:Protein-tyrosine-phosphatase n=1 Tax=Rhabditophanes sp. KR3021 TaxID=114890 RepID=A0AC35U5L6_9BILA
MQSFQKDFIIKKDKTDPSRLLNVILPTNFDNFRQFIAKVTDISPGVEFPIKDVNRTFLAFPSDSSTINIHGLHAGHQYEIAVFGRTANETYLIKEETIFMDPVPLNFHDNASITVMHTNITMRAVKPERALQDTFRVEYFQLSPPRRYPILDVHDIPEQKYVDFYLGNLNPGRDYDVKVMSLRADIPSQPWQGVITTKPLQITNLTITESNQTDKPECVILTWNLPPQSGADRFQILYGSAFGEGVGMHKLEVNFTQQTVKICDHIIPGESYLFAVSAEKSNQISDPSKITFTLRPLPPVNLSLVPNFERGQYMLTLHLADASQSKIDKCRFTITNEKSNKIEKTVNVETIEGISSCNSYLQLIPGQRYEVSAMTSNDKVNSTKILRNLALAPAFNLKAFELSLEENNGILSLRWPKSDLGMLKISEAWSKVVGNDSSLQLKIENSSGPKQIKSFSTNPYTYKDIIINNLIRGACYNVEIYTVTSTGIVSNEKFDQTMRITLTTLEISTENLSKQSTEVTITDTGNLSEWHENSQDCKLSVAVSDGSGLKNVYEKDIQMNKPNFSKASKIRLDNLKAYTKYTINSQITCGTEQQNDVCLMSTRAMSIVHFQTEQDVPGAVEGLKATPLNSYSSHVTWRPPLHPNGYITRYLIIVNPSKSNLITEAPWTITVNGNFDVNHDYKIDSVVDNLVGGQKYEVTVQAVTIAGTSSVSNSKNTVTIDMPIGAPPRPSTPLEVVLNTIRSTDLTIKYNMAMLSSKNGALTKISVIVAEVDPKTDVPRKESSSSIDSKPYTWGRVQNYEISPAYVTSINKLKPAKQWPSKMVSEVVGIESNCNDKPEDLICNGPLKADTRYRFKLRLYTSDNLWTDTYYSEVVTTEPLKSGLMYRTVLILFIIVILIAAVVVILICVSNCRMPSKEGIKKRPVIFEQSSNRSSNDSNHKNTQWAAFKILMRDRAAGFVNKFGQNSDSGENNHSSSVSSNPISRAFISFSLDKSRNDNQNIITVNNSSRVSAYDSIDNSKTPISSPIMISHTNGQLLNGPMGSRSLKQRTGFDKRLESLGNVPQKIILHTVAKTDNPARSRPVRIQDFAEHVRLMSADSDFRFSEEYEDLKMIGINLPAIASELPVNRAKNRFTNILPYDHSRVKLVSSDDDEGSDYVNANYIPGFNSRREFIAAQGPLPSTRDNFWQMVWEQYVPFIVALTKCVEKGRDKCHQYWPDADQMSVLYGDIEVTLMNETIYEDYTLRELKLLHIQNNVSRIVFHLHYKAWPDFGVPAHPTGILHIVRLFRSKVPPSKNCRPSIIHCSAGVGRSGTFITIDRLLQCMTLNQTLDVFGYVHEMRLERCQMVQNEQQYVFIHICILHAIEKEMTRHNQQQHFANNANNIYILPQAEYNGSQHQLQNNQNGSNVWVTPLTMGTFHNNANVFEVHQNPLFIEDDEGIAESGL